MQHQLKDTGIQGTLGLPDKVSLNTPQWAPRPPCQVNMLIPFGLVGQSMSEIDKKHPFDTF
jgi:hypothetical protein